MTRQKQMIGNHLLRRRLNRLELRPTLRQQLQGIQLKAEGPN
jgi:hypothetical protein